MKFQSLTNVRPVKDLGSQIIAAPTEGQIKVTPDAADKLGVAVGDYVQIVKDENGTQYVVKGETGVGGKLASSNKGGGGILTFSSANAWDALGGDSDFNVHFNIAEEPTMNDEDEDDDNAYYILTEDSRVEKQSRKSKSDSTEEVVQTTETPNEGLDDDQFADV